MRNWVTTLGLLFFVMTGAHAAEDPSLQIIFPDHQKTYHLSELKQALPVRTMTLNDPVYHKQMTYDGFALSDFLALAGSDQAHLDELVFQAQDGYSPNVSLSTVHEHAGLLAFREHGTKKPWEKVQQGKAWFSPGPFYLVWQEGEKLAESVPWPYQLVKIEFVDFQKKFPKVYPSGTNAESREMKGFHQFKSLCIRCHSINLQGGDLGPELNVPKNVTEYWSEDNLRSLIRNSGSFRAKSKMPPFPQLSDSDIGDLLAYLEWMKKHKE